MCVTNGVLYAGSDDNNIYAWDIEVIDAFVCIVVVVGVAFCLFVCFIVVCCLSMSS